MFLRFSLGHRSPVGESSYRNVVRVPVPRRVPYEYSACFSYYASAFGVLDRAGTQFSNFLLRTFRLPYVATTVGVGYQEYVSYKLVFVHLPPACIWHTVRSY